MADPGSGYGGPDAASQAAGAAAEAAASSSSSSSGFSGPASTGMSDNFGMHDDSFGQQEYGGPNNLGGFSQDHVQASFNAVNQITSTNPYGKQGFFSRVLGFDPNSIDYSNNMDLSTRLSIANNQFSKFANPQNTPGQLGYNPQYASAPVGQVRSGVQKAGYQTAYGPVMEQARKQGIGEMLARGAMGLFGGPIGMLMGQLGTQEYGLPGQPGFDSFDPNNPRAGGGILGAMLGGLNPTQAKEALVGAFAPVAPAPTPTQIGSVTPSQYETRADIIARTSQHPLTGEKTVSSPVDNTLQPGFSRTTTETLPDGRTITVDKETGAVLGTNLFGGQQSSLQNTVAGEQLAGSLFDSLFRDPMISPEAREILKEKGMTIDDLFAPKTPTPEPEKPDIMDLIQGATQTSALGGPATANQYADLSGLFSQGMAAVGDIVSIPGGYMDTRTGKQYSGRYNPSTSGRTYTGTQRPSGVAPFSGAALRQGLANLWGS
jgi:hypothetical protein